MDLKGLKQRKTDDTEFLVSARCLHFIREIRAIRGKLTFVPCIKPNDSLAEPALTAISRNPLEPITATGLPRGTA
jgi:hypothetical protein